jgi:hypothetical protein
MLKLQGNLTDLKDLDIDVNGWGHVPVADIRPIGWNLVERVGGVVFGARCWDDMQEIEVEEQCVQAYRAPGYGKPLFVRAGGAELYVFRFVHCRWYRVLPSGGAPLDESNSFVCWRIRAERLKAPWHREPVTTADKPVHKCGPFRLDSATGTVTFSGVTFHRGKEIDVESPIGACSRQQGESVLRILLPEDRPLEPETNYWVDLPRHEFCFDYHGPSHQWHHLCVPGAKHPVVASTLWRKFERWADL